MGIDILRFFMARKLNSIFSSGNTILANFSCRKVIITEHLTKFRQFKKVEQLTLTKKGNDKDTSIIQQD